MDIELVWAHDLRSRLRVALLSRSPHEHGGAVLAHFEETAHTIRALAVDHLLPTDEEVNVRGDDALEIDPAFWARVAKQARRRSMSVLPIHTHPFGDGVPGFSRTDVMGEARLLPVLARLTGAPTGAVVMGVNAEAIAIWRDERRRVVGVCREIGSAPRRARPMPDSMDDAMLSRNVLAFGEAGQARLSSLRIAVVGASGTGSHVCQQLIRLGVGELVVIDDDRVGVENLNRIVTAFRDDADQGTSKADVTDRYGRAVMGPTVVTPVNGNILDPAVLVHLSTVDGMFSCTDTVASRAIMNRVAVQRLVPLWDCGTEISGVNDAGLRAFARVRVVFGGAACLRCMGVIDPDQLRVELLPESEREREVRLGYIREAGVAAPAVVSLNGVAASLVVMRFLEWAVGPRATSPGQWVYRSYAGDVRTVEAVAAAECPVCSVDGRLGRAGLSAHL